MEQIKTEIEKQIADINKNFYNFYSKLIFEELVDDDVDSLEILLAKVSKNYRAFKILSIVSVTFLILLITLSLLDVWKLTINFNLLGLIVMTLSIFKSTHIYFKVKVYLENKLFLLKILERIDMK